MNTLTRLIALSLIAFLLPWNLCLADSRNSRGTSAQRDQCRGRLGPRTPSSTQPNNGQAAYGKRGDVTMRYNSGHNNSGKDSMLDDNGRVSLRYRPSRDNDRKSSMLDGDGRVGLRYHPNQSGGEEGKTSDDEGRVKSRYRYGWDHYAGKDGEKRQDDAPEATAAGSSGVGQ